MIIFISDTDPLIIAPNAEFSAQYNNNVKTC